MSPTLAGLYTVVVHDTTNALYQYSFFFSGFYLDRILCSFYPLFSDRQVGELTNNAIVSCVQVFQKGSPIAKDFSEAILKLSEDGNITSLEKRWLTPSNECSTNSLTTNDTKSLSLRSFWGIFLISGATSTICFLLALARLQKNYRDHQRANGANQPTKNKTLGLARYFYNGKSNTSPERASPTTSFSFSANGMPSLDGWSSSRLESGSTSDATEHLGTSPPAEIQITTITDDNSDPTTHV